MLVEVFAEGKGNIEWVVKVKHQLDYVTSYGNESYNCHEYFLLNFCCIRLKQAAAFYQTRFAGI